MIKKPVKFLIRYSSEMALKGPKAKRQLTEVLKKNIFNKARIYDPSVKIIKRFNYLEMQTNDPDNILPLLKKIFGIASFSLVLAETNNDLDTLVELGEKTFAKTVTRKTFAVVVKTAGMKNFTSQTLKEKLGAKLLPYSQGVDLKNPKQEVRIDIINGIAYLSLERIKGAGGFPRNSQGTAIVLLSGGFDSSVAAWMLMKRGLLCHFVFCNLAGQAYLRSVLQVAKVLVEQWGGEQDLIAVPFDHILEDLAKNVKDSYKQVMLKRKMLQTAEHFAQNYHADAIVTGESLSQVSSQTLKNLRTIEEITSLPILRPLIGMDKQEIIDQSYRIGTGFLSEHIKERCHITHTFPTLAATSQECKAQEGQMNSLLLDTCLASSQKFNLDTLDIKKLQKTSLFKTQIAKEDHIIDCQPRHLYKSHHLRQALHIEPDLMQTKIKSLDPQKSYLIYCTYGTISAMMAEYLQQKGFEAYAFLGGIQNLKKLYPNAF